MNKDICKKCVHYDFIKDICSQKQKIELNACKMFCKNKKIVSGNNNFVPLFEELTKGQEDTYVKMVGEPTKYLDINKCYTFRVSPKEYKKYKYEHYFTYDDYNELSSFSIDGLNVIITTIKYGVIYVSQSESFYYPRLYYYGGLCSKEEDKKNRIKCL